ncbi:MAG: FHA domain-containing protein, partial [Planctomycetota bacterium]
MSGHLQLANGTLVPIKNGFVLGRVPGCDLVLDDSKASRKHARFIVEAGVVEIEDLQSSNGTLLNDKEVTRRLLREGDRIQIGKTVIVFHERELPAAAGGGAGAAAPAVAAGLDDNDLFGATEIAAPRPAPPSSPPPL